MVAVGLPTVIGAGAMLGTLAAIIGFALAVRTHISAIQLMLLVGGLVISSVTGVVLVPQVQTATTVLAYVIMMCFPLYALFWILHDFVERVVKV